MPPRRDRLAPYSRRRPPPHIALPAQRPQILILIPPTPAHLADVISRMKEQRAHVILVDFYLDARTAETVASRTDATVVPVSQFPGAIKGTEQGYIALMDYLVDSLAKAFAAHKP